MAAADVVEAYMAALPGGVRRLAGSEWGVTLEPDAGAGWPLDIGLRIADGLLRAQAFVAQGDERIDPWLLLRWNRQTRLVRFACTRGRDIWIHGEIPVAAVDERAIDRLLGLVAEGAAVARRYAAEAVAGP